MLFTKDPTPNDIFLQRLTALIEKRNNLMEFIADAESLRKCAFTPREIRLFFAGSTVIPQLHINTEMYVDLLRFASDLQTEVETQILNLKHTAP